MDITGVQKIGLYKVLLLGLKMRKLRNFTRIQRKRWEQGKRSTLTLFRCCVGVLFGVEQDSD